MHKKYSISILLLIVCFICSITPEAQSSEKNSSLEPDDYIYTEKKVMVLDTIAIKKVIDAQLLELKNQKKKLEEESRQLEKETKSMEDTIHKMHDQILIYHKNIDNITALLGLYSKKRKIKDDNHKILLANLIDAIVIKDCENIVNPNTLTTVIYIQPGKIKQWAVGKKEKKYDLNYVKKDISKGKFTEAVSSYLNELSNVYFDLQRQTYKLISTKKTKVNALKNSINDLSNQVNNISSKIKDCSSGTDYKRIYSELTGKDNYPQKEVTTRVKMRVECISSFTVGGKTIYMPTILDFKPLLERVSTKGRTLKSITFYGPSPSGGYGYMYDNLDSYKNASSISEVKKIFEPISMIHFDHSNNVVEINDGDANSYVFTYYSNHYPTKITSESEGYRGSPSYKVQYDINWNNNIPSSMTRKIIKFESDFGEKPSSLDFETDFRLDIREFVNNLVNYYPHINISGDSYRFDTGKYNDLPVWCEITYY